MATGEHIPDDETADMQREEVHALEAIFEGALDLRSPRLDGDKAFEFPIVYRVNLNEMDVDAGSSDEGTTNWPKRPLVVQVVYPIHYPSDSDEYDPATTVPTFELLHDNTVLEFPSRISEKLLDILRETARNEQGMPSVLSCLYAARDFLDGEREWDAPSESRSEIKSKRIVAKPTAPKQDTTYSCLSTHHLLDHKPDNLLKTGHKFGLNGFYKFGTPGIAMAWGNQESVEDFVDTLRKAMPQKKFELVFCRSWTENETPNGWKSVDPQGLREELEKIGVPEEDYFTALGVEKKQGKSKGTKSKTSNK